MTSPVGRRRRRTRTTAIAAAVLTVAALVITGFALRYPGLTSSEVEVNNGGVWVTNASQGLAGRVNVNATELDARLSLAGDDLEILQSGYHVFAKSGRGLTPIDTASVSSGSMVELPPESQVALGGDRIVIADASGQVWILSVDEVPSFSPEAIEPAYETGGSAAQVAVSDAGTVFVLDGSDLLTFPHEDDVRKTSSSSTTTVDGVSTGEESLEMTTVGEEPVILDRENRLLRLGEDATAYDLTEHGITDLDDARLQLPSAASDGVALATSDSLVQVPLGGGDPQIDEAGGSGTPVAPAQAEGCAYGAWNGSKRYVRACEGQQTANDVIEEATDTSDLVLRQNHGLVVLNDQQFGNSWMIAENMEIVKDWQIQQELQTDESTEESQETLTTTVSNLAVERDEENRPPVAEDDQFGVRPGKSIVLPVTRNDTDPDGDVLTVALEGEQPSIGTVTPIQGGTQLQIEVAEDASGSASFTYVASDGRGLSDTATVTLDVAGDGESEPPAPAEGALTKVQVRSGQEVSMNLLPYWEDPEGDAFYLSNATTEPDDLVTFSADGTVTFNDAGLETGTKTVQLSFRDETGAVGEGKLEVEAVDDPDLAPITTADHVSIVAGQSTTISPLANDINPGGGRLEMTNVSEADGLEVEPVLETGTVRISGDSPGTHYLEYTAAGAGSSSSSLGLIRVDVVEPESDDLRPVAVDDMATATTGGSTLVDPLQNDVDPTGGVLVVNSVTAPESSGLKATVVDHSLVRVEAAPGATVGDEPVPLTYEVANSAGSTEGTIRVMLAKTDTQFSNPVAAPDRATVRAGDVATVDVLANDTSPTGADLRLGELTDTEQAEQSGSLEVHDDRVRFVADADASGTVSFGYTVVDDTGRTAGGRVEMDIVAADAPNTAPTPENLTARTLSGTSVRIPVPTSGIDPEGDSVMLTGISSPAPTKGEVTSANGEWIEYTPHDGESGTDRFRYQVMDPSGAIGTAEVQVGIAAPPEMNQPPYAVDDSVVVRPDREVQIPVLDNDTDPEGAPLSIATDQTEPLTDIEVLPPEESVENMVTVRTPSEEGVHSIMYAASDGQLTSPATITVTVDPEAPLLPPIARDDYVDAKDVMDESVEHIDVDVLANDSDPDGSTADLDVTLEEGAENAQLMDDGIVRVTPQDEQQHIRYQITDVDGQTSSAYIWVPGRAKQAPVWVGDPVQVRSGAEAQIDLSSASNVRVRPGGRPATITDASTVSASHADGSELVTGESSLTYRSADGYSGQDSISVEVTDGEPGDSTAATATLAIPVEVQPAEGDEENLPPEVQGASLKVEQGGDPARVDVAASASDPEGDELTYSLGSVNAATGVDITMDGSTVVAEATSRAATGTVIDVPVQVSDGHNDPVTVPVQVSVTKSNRPLISAAMDEATIDAGSTKAIDVLANDSNPFPDEDRTLVDATLVSGEGGVSVAGDKVEITPDADFHGILTAQYSVDDATGDPERRVTGEIRVTVLGTPDQPSVPRVGEVGDGFAELSFEAGADNGSPITEYTVQSASGPPVSTSCSSTSCRIEGLANNTEYTFAVTSINGVGESEPSKPSAVVRPDVRPETPSAPEASRGDQQLDVTWSAPENRGSAIQEYDVQIQSTASGEPPQTRTVDAGTTSIPWTDLHNGTDYRFRVRAHNLAEEPSEFSAWSKAEHPAGRPAAPSAKPQAKRVDTPLGGEITVSWDAMSSSEANGEPITKYVVSSSSGESRTVDAASGTNSASFRDLDRNSEHTFTYIAVNSVGESVGPSARSDAVTPWAVPDAPTDVSASLPSKGEGDGPDGRADVTWKAADGKGTDIEKYVVRWGSDGRKEVPASETSTRISSLSNGTSYSFTVTAVNRFDGGVSDRSSASNKVTPYTSPQAPRISGSSQSCSGITCPVTFTVEARGDGGDPGGNAKIQYKVDGGSWQTKDGTKATVTIDKAQTGSKHTIEARVVNSAGLTSGSQKGSQTAKTVNPEFTGMTVVAKENLPPTCDSEVYCRKIDIGFKNLDPSKTYELRMFTNNPDDHSQDEWWRFERAGQSTTLKITPNSDGTWSYHDQYGSYLYYGIPRSNVDVYLDGTKKGNFEHPLKSW